MRLVMGFVMRGGKSITPGENATGVGAGAVDAEPGPRRRPGPLPARAGRPVVLALAGSACISASAVFMKLSGTNAGTGAFLRCALALFLLVPLAWRELRRVGARPLRYVLMDIGAGVLLGVDMVFWAAAVLNVGASVTTVLLNVQVVVFPLLARLVSGTRLTGRFLLMAPLMLAGVALASGALGHPRSGSDPVAGVTFGTASGVAYAGYLFLMRLGGGREHTTTPVCVSTAAAAAAAAVMGGLWTGIDLDPGWPAWGWLIALAFVGQVLAWLLITAALPRLAPNVGAALLLLQPVMAFGLGVAIGERPTLTQAVGCAVVVTAVWYTGRTPRGRRRVSD
ncbi:MULTISPECIES: DMT family transporter [unclassified Streptomyces]|uniref:DMT family transporter n=1 Tax=unclassified Streptomyces TaxID=2593676 RepID=UPI000A30FE0E|nr:MULTISPECIES: DMT family transporter [unclassified Streptomyces]MYT33053.1 EamA family transporter [Streptomyces sp. SID8354]